MPLDVAKRGTLDIKDPPLKAIVAANDNYDKGYHEGNVGGLDAVDVDLATANILTGKNIFGKAGTVVPMDVSDADALVTDVKDPKTFYSVAAPVKTGTMPTVAIVAANDNYPAGYHAGDAGGLDAIDLDLATANIKSGITIFGKAGSGDVRDSTDADAAVTDVKAPKTFYAGGGARKDGTLATVALAADNPAYPAGYHVGAASLAAIDADLAVGNIKSGMNIFGYVGTVVPQGVETLEKYADASLASGATYTPAASGIFSGIGRTYFQLRYYSTLASLWYAPNSGTAHLAYMAIGDGTNFQIKNNYVGSVEYLLFRHYYSTGTYERNKDEELAGGATYTPATSGFFGNVSDLGVVYIEVNLTTAGWLQLNESPSNNQPIALAIGDGTNLRARNGSGSAYYHVMMRCKLT